MMKFIVQHKHMNAPKLMIVALSAIALALSVNRLSAKAAETQPGNSGKTFADWCREKASLSPEAKHTVEVLLRKSKTTECDAADRKLSSLTELYLDNNEISDIKPLQSLTQLTNLHLSRNEISDIKPLQSLTQLSLLALDNNLLSDIKPLASLTQLIFLGLSDNKISDIKPLQSLTELDYLSLENNQISNIKPLQSLTNLNYLSLGGNLITPKICPMTKPESICSW
ncbi:leucine-rich repeat domain-containing protein [Lyngbya sp. CCAP 1446/10]|uniref:leucine-rich repeat domain-containing protein n=1 Tax=Lyngbya sp. CCAP 1446/10 TaxID=439293 RepID=UPI002237C798|nr:leucine-rich repeat domain-containing protein [Lyngbya sp. CCAP 1446/10]